MAENLTNPNSIESTLLATIPRHVFNLPEAMRKFPGDPAEVVMRELTGAEDIQAQEAANARKTPYAYEILKRAIVEADGKPITWQNDEKERFFGGLSVGVRNALLIAFNKFAQPSEEDMAAFLGSEQIKA